MTEFIFIKEMEGKVGRVINPQPVGRERRRLVRAVALALRELSAQKEPDQQTRDLAAFVALALKQIGETVEQAVVPWEKRGYWLKADRFRLEWAWAARLGERLRTAVLAEDWGQVAALAGQIAEKVQGEHIPARHRMGKPWVGAWERLNATK